MSKLTDEAIDAAREVARKTFRRSQSQIRGQQITASDDPEWHFARAIESAATEPLLQRIAELEHQLDAMRAQIGQGVPDVGDLRDRLVAISSAVAEQNDRLAQALIGDTLALLASAPPAPQQKPLTDEQITAGAKALCKRSSEICGVNADDNWNLESEYFKDDARCVLEAAHNIGEKK